MMLDEYCRLFPDPNLLFPLPLVPGMDSKQPCCDFLQDDYPMKQRILFGITFIINALGYLLIYFKSPPMMKEFKKYLLFHQMFIMNLDAQLTLLGCPSFLFPMLGAHLYGLYNLLQMNGNAQLFIFLFSAGGYLGSVLLMLFGRQQAILPHKHFFHIPNNYQKQAWVFIFCVNIAITLPIAILLPWSQYEAKVQYQKSYPCISAAIWDNDSYVIWKEDENLVVLIINLLMAVFITISCILTIPTGYLLIWKHKVMSKARRKIQTAFFISLLIQIGCPVLISAGPILFFSFSGHLYYNRIPLNNLIIHFTSIHGAVSTLTMMVTYKSYRYAIYGLFGCGKEIAPLVTVGDKRSDSQGVITTTVH